MSGNEDAYGTSAPRRVPPFIYVTLAVVLGLFLIAAAWDRLHPAQRAGTLATAGPYAVIRHPQYVGFIAILVGFLLQWLALLTLMRPLLGEFTMLFAAALQRRLTMQLTKYFLATTLATVIGAVGATAQDASHHPAAASVTTAPVAPPATKPGQGTDLMQPGPSASDGLDMVMMRECMGMMSSMMEGMGQDRMAASGATRPGMPMGQGAGMMQGQPGASGGAGMHMMGKCMGMMGRMMQGMGSGAMMAETAPDDPVDGAFAAINRRMHRDMAIPAGGNPDAAFAQAMIAHHQGAIDMARVILSFGTDPAIHKLAQDVITAQEAEIRFLRQWFADQPKP